MRPPHARATLSVKLALVFFGVVLGALGIVYLLVVPRLENRLVDAKIDELERAAPSLVRQLRKSDSIVEFQDNVSFAAANLNARIVVFTRLDDTRLIPVADSNPLRGGDVATDPLAVAAASSGLTSSGRVERDERVLGEVAVPVDDRTVLLLAAPLDDALSNVQLVRRSVLIAGLVALLASALAAYGAAWGLTRRLRRLEGAAERIAGGDFHAPVEARGSDEVAQLARGFESMRARLADLDRVRREFIANASHELRTPLFSLGGFLELLADEDLDDATRREFLDETRAQVERLAKLATDLLDLSRLDAGQLTVERAEVDVAVAAETVVEEFRPAAETGRHELRLAARGPVRALADEQRVLQIARILVENALRHTPAGTLVQVSAEEVDGQARLAVRDEGPGIPPGDEEHIFERFYRAQNGHAAGSGLGLAIASELAAKMNGSMSVSSRPGDTVFTLRLPAVSDDPGRDVPRENGHAAHAERGSPGRVQVAD